VRINPVVKNILIGGGAVVLVALALLLGFKHFVLNGENKGHTGFPRSSNRVVAQADSDSVSYDPFAKTTTITDSVLSEPNWLDELYGPQSLVGLRIKFTRFAETSQTKDHRQAGLDLAAALIRLYNRPWTERSGECMGLNLRDPVAIMEKVVAILTEIGCTPQDIPSSGPMTQEKMRQLIHKDLYTALLQVRLLSDTSNESEESMDNGELRDELFRYIKAAVDTYGFSLEDLGLTQSEQDDFNSAFMPATDS
jgi:hypothetical protein